MRSKKTGDQSDGLFQRIASISFSAIPIASGACVVTEAMISPETALLAAAENVGLTLEATPARTGRPNASTVIFEPLEGCCLQGRPPQATLAYIALSRLIVHAVWRVSVPMPDSQSTYDIIIDATDGQVIARENAVKFAKHKESRGRSS